MINARNGMIKVTNKLMIVQNIPFISPIMNWTDFHSLLM